MTQTMTRTVLVVDDEFGTRKRYKKVLKSAGFDVLEAPDAVEVVNSLMRDKSRIDLILLDLQIPEVDGRGIFEILTEYAPQIDIMVSSILPLQEQKLRIPRAVGYFNKAENDTDFLRKVKSALGVE